MFTYYRVSNVIIKKTIVFSIPFYYYVLLVNTFSKLIPRQQDSFKYFNIHSFATFLSIFKVFFKTLNMEQAVINDSGTIHLIFYGFYDELYSFYILN